MNWFAIDHLSNLDIKIRLVGKQHARGVIWFERVVLRVQSQLISLVMRLLELNWWLTTATPFRSSSHTNHTRKNRCRVRDLLPRRGAVDEIALVAR